MWDQMTSLRVLLVQRNGETRLEPQRLAHTHLVIQVIVALIHLLLSQVPFVFHVDVWVELSGFSLGKLKGTAGAAIVTQTPNTPTL